MPAPPVQQAFRSRSRCRCDYLRELPIQENHVQSPGYLDERVCEHRCLDSVQVSRGTESLIPGLPEYAQGFRQTVAVHM